MSATQSGMIATISAASPDSRRVSAQATPPLPIRRRAAPTIAAEPHCRRWGGRAARGERVQRRPGDQEAHGRHQEWGHRPVGDPDREVGRAPNEIDRRQGGDDRCRRAAGECGGHDELERAPVFRKTRVGAEEHSQRRDCQNEDEYKDPCHRLMIGIRAPSAQIDL
jgi:hypothetical protein